MRNAATGGSSVQTEGEADNHGSVVANLQSLIGHIQASIALVEAAVASEFCDGNQDAAADIFVLDDVTALREGACGVESLQRGSGRSLAAYSGCQESGCQQLACRESGCQDFGCREFGKRTPLDVRAHQTIAPASEHLCGNPI